MAAALTIGGAALVQAPTASAAPRFDDCSDWSECEFYNFALYDCWNFHTPPPSGYEWCPTNVYVECDEYDQWLPNSYYDCEAFLEGYCNPLFCA
jgi:hypothetical protein